MRRARLAELVTRKREQRKGRGRDGDSTLGGGSSLVRSSGLREEIHDVYADPTYHEGDYVVILGTQQTQDLELGTYFRMIRKVELRRQSMEREKNPTDALLSYCMRKGVSQGQGKRIIFDANRLQWISGVNKEKEKTEEIFKWKKCCRLQYFVVSQGQGQGQGQGQKRRSVQRKSLSQRSQLQPAPIKRYFPYLLTSFCTQTLKNTAAHSRSCNAQSREPTLVQLQLDACSLIREARWSTLRDPTEGYDHFQSTSFATIAQLAITIAKTGVCVVVHETQPLIFFKIST